MERKDIKQRMVEAYVTDAMLQKPIEFTLTYKEKIPIEIRDKQGLFRKVVKRIEEQEKEITKTYNIAPPTLGKMQLLSKEYLMLDIDEAKLKEEPHIEAMRVCESKTDVVCRIMAVAVTEDKEHLLDDSYICNLADFFKWNAETKDFSAILLIILALINYENFMNSIRLAKLLRQNEPKS